MKEKYITIQKISFIAFFLLGTIQILNMIFISNKIFETYTLYSTKITIIPFTISAMTYGLSSLRLYFYKNDSKLINLILISLIAITSIIMLTLLLLN